jgi:3-hydroxybutyryl-CoA dehydratase
MTELHAGRRYADISVGEEFTSAMTITEAHLTLGAGLIADYNPLHVNETFARQSRYRSRILHGVITSAILGGPVGMIFAGTAIAYLEHNTRFLAPVRVGDTLTLRWTVEKKIAKPAHDAGIVAMTGTATNQDGVTVAEANGKMLVGL